MITLNSYLFALLTQTNFILYNHISCFCNFYDKTARFVFEMVTHAGNTLRNYKYAGNRETLSSVPVTFKVRDFYQENLCSLAIIM